MILPVALPALFRGHRGLHLGKFKKDSTLFSIPTMFMLILTGCPDGAMAPIERIQYSILGILRSAPTPLSTACLQIWARLFLQATNQRYTGGGRLEGCNVTPPGFCKENLNYGPHRGGGGERCLTTPGGWGGELGVVTLVTAAGIKNRSFSSATSPRHLQQQHQLQLHDRGRRPAVLSKPDRVKRRFASGKLFARFVSSASGMAACSMPARPV